ncbi:MAG: tail fiber protein [Coleofasciculus sp. C1-SOL-03]|jgi:microcystin-dependent protein|uniref:phage tail protein n=1 Tax=Coleofasciculus sp. C1-SOL-03 TaxID=3069522 RepID=UPI003301754C
MITSFPAFLLGLQEAEGSFSATLPYGKLEEFIMTTPFIGQIAMVAFDFAPDGWYLCDGTLHDIISNENDILASILAGKYNQPGDPTQGTFRVPDLRGRVPLGINPMGGNSDNNRNSYGLGDKSGSEQVELTQANLPEIQLKLKATNADSNETRPSGAILSKPRSSIYATGATDFVEMDCISSIGSNENNAHNNLQPYLAINFIIAYQGIDPRP